MVADEAGLQLAGELDAAGAALGPKKEEVAQKGKKNRLYFLRPSNVFTLLGKPEDDLEARLAALRN